MCKQADRREQSSRLASWLQYCMVYPIVAIFCNLVSAHQPPYRHPFTLYFTCRLLKQSRANRQPKRHKLISQFWYHFLELACFRRNDKGRHQFEKEVRRRRVRNKGLCCSALVFVFVSLCDSWDLPMRAEWEE